MSALDGNKEDHPPSVFVPLLPDRERWDTLVQEIAKAKGQLAERAKAVRPEFDGWLTTAKIEAVEGPLGQAPVISDEPVDLPCRRWC
jgi:hypothetical protein